MLSHGGLTAFHETAELRLVVLTLAYEHGLRGIVHLWLLTTHGVAPRLACLHLLALPGYHPVGLLAHLLKTLPRLEELRALHELCYAAVHAADLALLGLEMAIGLLRIEDGRHEERPVVTPTEQTRVGSKERKAPVRGLNNEHAIHLAAHLARCQLRVLLHISSHAASGNEGESAGRLAGLPPTLCSCHVVQSVVETALFGCLSVFTVTHRSYCLLFCY